MRPRHRLCPACTRRSRTHELIDPDCVICDGEGRLTLGEGALNFFPAEAVAHAVLLALEAKARLDDEAKLLSDDRLAGVREALELLHDAGILDNTHGAPTALTARLAALPEATPERLAQEAVQEVITGLDRILASADPHAYTEHDRPNQRGLPVLSRDGHPSHLARVTDPADPQGSTREHVRWQKRTLRQGRILWEAAPEAAQDRRRRAANQAEAEVLELFTAEDVLNDRPVMIAA